MIDIVFLDAGETILRPHPSFEELFSATAGARGYKITSREVSDVRERIAPHLVDLAAEDDDSEPVVTARGTSVSATKSRSFWTHLYGSFLDELGIVDDALAGALYEVFSSAASYKLYDDVLPALHDITAAGHRLGLISNFERWLEDMLVELEVGGVFDVAVISGIEGVEKPDPGIYELALERAGADAAAAVHVGDSVGLDIEPAGAVGMHTVLLDRAGRYTSVAVPAGATIASLGELPDILDRL